MVNENQQAGSPSLDSHTSNESLSDPLATDGQIQPPSADSGMFDDQPRDSDHQPGDSNDPVSNADTLKGEYSDASEILDLLQQGHLLMVNSRRKNGLILYKKYHAEFAGPGAAVGSFFDLDCQRVLPVGDLSLIPPHSHDERQKAFLIRRQWIRLTQQFTDSSVSLKRAQMILNQFEVYFDQDTISQIPDEAFSLLVGVLPYTIRMARRPPRKLNVKVKS
ncbi:MAG: hypothetical protein ACFE0J_13380 [Elainellaceae cyanobacterium]